jgi:hypothetical protein
LRLSPTAGAELAGQPRFPPEAEQRVSPPV